MTTLNEARVAVVDRFLASITGIPASRVVLQNEDEKFTDGSDAAWMRLSVLHQTRGQETLGKSGNRKYRSFAQVVVQVYTLIDTGLQSGDTLATEAKDIFEGVNFGGLAFNNGMVRESGPGGKWYMHIAEIDFDYEEIK